MLEVVDEVGLPRPDLPTRFDSVEAFAAAYEGVEGKCELVDGEVVWLVGERFVHSEVKAHVGTAFLLAIRERNAPLRLLIDGPIVEISRRQGRQPDVMIVARNASRPRDIVTAMPLLTVEIISDSSVRMDTVVKLAEYFSLSSLSHYLIVDADDRLVAWHRRTAGGIVTSVHADGTLEFTDIGIGLDVASIWPPDLDE